MSFSFEIKPNLSASGFDPVAFFYNLDIKKPYAVLRNAAKIDIISEK